MRVLFFLRAWYWEVRAFRQWIYLIKEDIHPSFHPEYQLFTTLRDKAREAWAQMEENK